MGGVVMETFHVGDAFECLHGSSLFDVHKKARWWGERDGGAGVSVRGGQGGCCVGINDVVRGASGFILCDTDNCELDH